MCSYTLKVHTLFPAHLGFTHSPLFPSRTQDLAGELLGDKWTERSHELLMGHNKDHVNPSIMMWYKRTKGEQPITAIGASFNEDEEQFYIADGYNTCSEDLKKYSLGQGVLRDLVIRQL